MVRSYSRLHPVWYIRFLVYRFFMRTDDVHELGCYSWNTSFL